MQAKTRTNQGGSVINFLIVGVILAAIALGAIFFAQQRGKAPVEGPKVGPVTTSPSPAPSQSPQAPSSSPRPTAEPSRTPSPAVVPQTGVMPETGPAEDMVTAVLPLAVLVAATAAYVQSRRATS